MVVTVVRRSKGNCEAYMLIRAPPTHTVLWYTGDRSICTRNNFNGKAPWAISGFGTINYE